MNKDDNNCPIYIELFSTNMDHCPSSIDFCMLPYNNLLRYFLNLTAKSKVLCVSFALFTFIFQQNLVGFFDLFYVISYYTWMLKTLIKLNYCKVFNPEIG